MYENMELRETLFSDINYSSGVHGSNVETSRKNGYV